MIIQTEDFQKSYEIESLTELGSEKRLYFPGGCEVGGNDGLIVKIFPYAYESWVGIFALGDVSPNGISAICSMPSRDKVCVVSMGAGYIISSHNPADWEGVKAIPIMDVKSVEAKGLILFADYTNITAYDVNGWRWRSKRLAWDGLRIVGVDDRVLIGKYYDIRTGGEGIFEVDLDDGSSVGGVEAFE